MTPAPHTHKSICLECFEMHLNTPSAPRVCPQCKGSVIQFNGVYVRGKRKRPKRPKRGAA